MEGRHISHADWLFIHHVANISPIFGILHVKFFRTEVNFGTLWLGLLGYFFLVSLLGTILHYIMWFDKKNWKTTLVQTRVEKSSCKTTKQTQKVEPNLSNFHCFTLTFFNFGLIFLYFPNSSHQAEK